MERRGDVRPNDPVYAKIRGAKSCRTLRDGCFLGRIPGNKLPGYHHLVPYGTDPTSAAGRLPYQTRNLKSTKVNPHGKKSFPGHDPENLFTK
jgi:hypothetical protein